MFLISSTSTTFGKKFIRIDYNMKCCKWPRGRTRKPVRLVTIPEFLVMMSPLSSYRPATPAVFSNILPIFASSLFFSLFDPQNETCRCASPDRTSYSKVSNKYTKQELLIRWQFASYTHYEASTERPWKITCGRPCRLHGALNNVWPAGNWVSGREGGHTNTVSGTAVRQ